MSIVLSCFHHKLPMNLALDTVYRSFDTYEQSNIKYSVKSFFPHIFIKLFSDKMYVVNILFFSFLEQLLSHSSMYIALRLQRETLGWGEQREREMREWGVSSCHQLNELVSVC